MYKHTVVYFPNSTCYPVIDMLPRLNKMHAVNTEIVGFHKTRVVGIQLKLW